MTVESVAAPRSAPSHRWRVLGIGVAANGCMGAAISGIPATAILLRASYGLDTSALGRALAALGLGLAVSELPWGIVADRLGDRRVLLTGLVLSGLVFLLMTAFVGPTDGYSTRLLAPALLLIGAIGGSLNGSSGRAVMAWFPEAERGFAMSIRQMSLPVGGALGAFILPGTAQHWGFRAAYGELAASCLSTASFAWAWLHEPPSPTSPARPATHARAQNPLREWQTWRTVCAVGALCVPQVAVVTFAAVFLNDVVGLGTRAISAAIVTVQLLAAVARVASGRFTDRRKNRRPFLKACALSTALIFVSLAILLQVSQLSPAGSRVSVALAVVLLVLGGAVASAWHGIAYTELATIAGMDRVATALGLANTFAFASYFLTPWVIPLLLRAGTWQPVWLAAAATALLAFLLFPKPAAHRSE